MTMAATSKQLQLPLRNSLEMDTNPKFEQIWANSADSLGSSVSMDALASPKGNQAIQPMRYTARDFNLEKHASNSSSLSNCQYPYEESLSPLEKPDSLDSNYCSSTISNIEDSSLPSDSWECDIEKYKKDMPPHIKVGFIDVLILYAEEDRLEVERFRQHLINDIILDHYGPIKAWLYDCDDLQALCGGKIGHLAEGVRRSTYVFMFLTANFVKDKWMELSSESCLMEAIYNPEKMWCVVPVYTQKRSCCTFKIPMGLNTLKGINYYNPDEFYRKGVKRLIGDKVKVRVNNELEHKKNQKQWIETEKRRVAKMREEQKRLQEFEEGQTRLALDWLNHETYRLISEGVIPGFRHHFPSESSLSTYKPSMPQSASTSSLKSVPSWNPAVAEYFKEKLSGYDKNRQNSNCYTEEQFACIRQLVQDSQTPPVNTYQPGFYGLSLNQSVLYSQQQHMVKKAPSNSAMSGDGGAWSTQIFKLETAQGIMDVKIPMALHEKMLSCSEDDKKNYVLKYLNECNKINTVRNQTHLKNQLPADISKQYHSPYDSMNSGNMQHHANVPFVLNQNPQQTQGAALNPDPASTSAIQNLSSNAYFSNDSCLRQPHSATINNNLPNLQDLSIASYQKSGPVTSGTTSQPLSGNTSAGSSYTNQGIVPNFSMLDEDGPSMRAEHDLLSHKITQMPESEKDLYKEANNPITNEVEYHYDNKDRNRQKKIKPPTVIKNITVNVYSASAVQIGDNNTIQDIGRKGNVHFSNDDDDDDEEDVNDVRQKEYEKIGPMKDATKLIGTPWKGHISDVTDTHGEMSSSPEIAVVDAAPSTHHPRHNWHIVDADISVKETQKQHLVTEPFITQSPNKNVSKVKNQKIIQSRSQDINEAITGNVTDKKRNEQKLGLVDNGNMNSSHLTPGKTAYKPKELVVPFRPQPEQKAEKQFGYVKPITAVRPQIRDNTEVKKTFETEETTLKARYASENRDDEQTIVKQCATSSRLSANKMEHLQKSTTSPLPTAKVDGAHVNLQPVSPRILTGIMNDPYKLFYGGNRHLSTPNVGIYVDHGLSSMEESLTISSNHTISISADNKQLAKVRNMQGPSSDGFIPKPNLEGSMQYDMLPEATEYEIVPTFSEEVSKSGESKNSNEGSRGKFRGKECVIS